jgi:hypothetical protein
MCKSIALTLAATFVMAATALPIHADEKNKVMAETAFGAGASPLPGGDSGVGTSSAKPKLKTKETIERPNTTTKFAPGYTRTKMH